MEMDYTPVRDRSGVWMVVALATVAIWTAGIGFWIWAFAQPGIMDVSDFTLFGAFFSFGSMIVFFGPVAADAAIYLLWGA